MGILNFLRRGDESEKVINDLQEKVAVLEKSALSDSLGYVSDGNYYSYSLNNTEKSYKSNYTVYRGVNMLSDMIAQLPLKLYRGEQEMPLDYTFPNGFSLSKPNTSMSLNELLYVSCVHYFFHGEFINHIIDDGIFRLVPINPKNLHRNPDDTWHLNQNNRLIIIQKEGLIYNPLYNPTITNHNTSMDRGLSPIDIVKAEIEADSSAGKYITMFFKNYGAVGGTLIDKGIDKNNIAATDDMKRMVKQFDSMHQGEDKAYRTLGLPRGIEYKELSQTMREMQFLDSRKDIRDKILAVLGIHKSLLGETDAVNRSVAEEATRQVWVQTLKPKAIRIQEKYNQQFFNVYFPGYHCKFDFSEVKELQENMESIIKQAEAYRKLGYTLNEVNEHFKLGMEEITDPEGSQRYVPKILTTLEMMTTPITQTSPKEPVTPKKGVLEKAVDLLESIDSNVNKQDKDYRDTYLRKRAPLETKFTSKMKRYFFEMRKDVLKVVNDSKHIHNITNDLGVYFNDADIKIKEVTEPLYISGAELGVSIADAKVKIVSNSIDKEVIDPSDLINMDIVQNYTNKIVNVNHTIHNQIKLAVWENTKEGGSINDLSKKVKDIHNMASARSKLIARTESSGIINTSTDDRYKSLGVTHYVWTGGQRPAHSAVNGSKVRVGEEFACGLKFPGDQTGSGSTPANLCNCRCAFYGEVEG